MHIGWSTRFVTESKANRRAVTFLPVEDLKELAAPGVYVAVMSQPGRFRYEYQTTYFYVSDLGLHARLFTDNANVFRLPEPPAVAGAEPLAALLAYRQSVAPAHPEQALEGDLLPAAPTPPAVKLNKETVEPPTVANQSDDDKEEMILLITMQKLLRQ